MRLARVPCMPTYMSEYTPDLHESRLSDFRISVSIVVAFVARGLSSIRGSIFCYNAIASAGVVLILPGFTICKWCTDLLKSFLKPRQVISALELMSKNLFCGSVRIVYAIIYTLFLVSLY